MDFFTKFFRNIPKLWKKTWYYIWDDNHWTSWIVNVLLAVVMIKLIVYPGLGLLLGTSHPIVAVVSSSMEHQGDFDEWWASPAMCSSGMCTQMDWYEDIGISKSDFQSYPFKNGFNKGDLMVLYGKPPKSLKKGDVLVFTSARADPIIHRVVDIKVIDGKYYYHTKGDNNVKSIDSVNLDETLIPEDTIIGYQKYGKGSKAVLRIPYLGYVKIWVFKYLFGV